MKKINVSHEIPISYLEKSKSFNDYDYCLVHLTYERPEYQAFYEQSLREGRKVLLDNSLFELETMFDAEKFVEKIKEINSINSSNFEFVVPDALHEMEATINSFESFKNRFTNLPGKYIGVVQGKTVKEMLECYKYMSNHADKIAIPFDSKAFEELYPSNDKLESWCEGRQAFISTLVKRDLWNNDKPHHLLGCSYAKEFSYKLYNLISIESIDTSNPVVAGIKGLRYSVNGLHEKPSIKLCDLIDYQISDKEAALIDYNVAKFKDIVNGNT